MQKEQREKVSTPQFIFNQIANPSGRFLPLRFFNIIIASIFFAEVVAMVVVYRFETLPYYLTTLIDAGTMMLLIFPILYFFSFRPLMRQIQKLQQTEKALQLLSSVVEQTADTVVVTNCDGVIEYVNPAFEALTGYQKEETVGQTPRVLKSGIHDGQFYTKLWDTVLHGQVFHSEIANRKKNGEIFHEVKTITPLRNAQGELTHFVATGKDITERKLAEERLRKAYEDLELRVQKRTEELRIANSELEEEIRVRRRAEGALQDSEQRLERAQEIAHLGSWELDLVTNQLIWSDEVYRIFGLQPQEFGATYEAFLGAVHPDDRAAVHEAYSGSLRDGRDTYEIEHRVVKRSSGEIRFVHEKCEHFRNETRQIIRSVGMVHDITERKQAEEQLQYQATLLSNVNDAIVASDAQYRLTAWNAAAESLYGWKADEVIGRNGLEIMRTEWQDQNSDQMRRTIVETGGWRGEATQQRKDGTRFPVEVSSIVLHDAYGQITGYVSVNRDITERRQAEEQLEKSNQKLNEILASIQDDFYVLDRDWNFVYASRLFTAKVGKEPQNFVGNNIWTMFPKHVGTVLEENFRTAMEKREVQRFELGGKYTNAWYRMTVFPSAEGITVIGTDITERKQAEEALQKSETMLRTVLEKMPSGVTVRDASTGEIIISNARSRDILGDLVATTEQLSEYHGLHLDGTIYRSEEWPISRSIATGEQVDSEEIEIERSSGIRNTLSVSSAPIQDLRGKIISAVAIFHDITERKKAESELQQLNRTLQALSASNQAMMRAKNEAELLDEVCKIVVKDCGHAMIWIGYAQDDEEKSVRPVASAGFEEGYLETLKITWADTERGRGPTGTAIRTGEVRSCRNMLIDPQFAPWREQALKRGYASSIVLPLIAGGRTFGAMTIYSRKPDGFSLDEEKLLTELARDLSYGIEMIRLRDAHERTAAALRESEERFRLALTHAPVTVAVQNRDLYYTWAYNQHTQEIDEIIGKTDADLFPMEAEHLNALKKRVIETGKNVSEQIWINSNDSRFFLDLFIEPLKNEKGEIEGVGLAAVDLTAIKLAEEALRIAHDELELRVQERTAELAAANRELSNEIAERREVERQLRIQTAAMEAAANGIMITDPTGCILWANPAMSQISGYSKEDLIGQSTRLFNSGKHDSDFYKQMWQTIHTGNVWHGEITNRRKNNSLYVEEQTITPVRNEEGHLSHFIAIKQDVTERNLIQAQLEESNRELITLTISERQQRFLAEGLVESSAVLNMSLELYAVLDRIIEQTSRTIPYLKADIVLIEDDTATVVRQWGADDSSDERRTIVENETLKIHEFPIWERICATKSAILIPNTRLEDQWNTYFGMTWIRSYLGAPLIYNDQIIGIINLVSDKEYVFHEDMAKALRAFAAPAAVAIQNARLYENEQHNRKMAETLSAASVALVQTLDIQMVMETILDYAQSILPFEVAFVILSEGDERYRIRAIRTTADDNRLQDSLQDQILDLLNEPIVGPFFEKKVSTFIPDSREIPNWNPPAGLATVKCWLGIPLESMGKTLGIVVIAHSEPYSFKTNQIQLAEAVVKQAVVALQNAWLFEQVRSGRERLQQLSRHLVEIQENERKYIARELHDETSQSLTSLKMGLQVIEQKAAGHEDVTEQVQNLKDLADETLESLHHLAVNLRPASLDHLSLDDALTGLIESTRQRSGLATHFKSMGRVQMESVTEEIETSIYRIVQESITNVIRHAHATYVDVILDWQSDKIVIIIEDDGVGMDMEKARETGHLGLIGMQERAEMLGGKLVVDSTPQAGTTLVVEIPYVNSNTDSR